MLESRGRSDFAEETIGAEVRWRTFLDGDVAVMPEVVGEEDGGHAAGPDLAIDAIAVAEGFAQALKDVVGHGEAPGGGRETQVRSYGTRECITR